MRTSAIYIMINLLNPSAFVTPSLPQETSYPWNLIPEPFLEGIEFHQLHQRGPKLKRLCGCEKEILFRYQTLIYQQLMKTFWFVSKCIPTRDPRTKIGWSRTERFDPGSRTRPDRTRTGKFQNSRTGPGPNFRAYTKPISGKLIQEPQQSLLWLDSDLIPRLLENFEN